MRTNANDVHGVQRPDRNIHSDAAARLDRETLLIAIRGVLATNADELPVCANPSGSRRVVKVGREIEPSIASSRVGVLGDHGLEFHSIRALLPDMNRVSDEGKHILRSLRQRSAHEHS